MTDCCPGEIYQQIYQLKRKRKLPAMAAARFYKSHISFILIKSLVKIDIGICGDAGEIARCLRILVT